MQELIIEHLTALVAFDTQNPPREITAAHPIFAYLADALGPKFTTRSWDHGEGKVSFLAQRGAPRILFNVHLDTVPVGTGWRHDPLTLTLANGRAYGRGACDIKGAVACLLALAATNDAPLALLFTTDEEGASGSCVKEFCASDALAAFSHVVVAEPTQCRAVLSHRGYLSVLGQFIGRAGHSSEARAFEDNAVHKLVRWSAHALEVAARTEGGACFNLGTVSGGISGNVIADRADLKWSARLPPGGDNEIFFAQVCGATNPCDGRWDLSFTGPPLPALGSDTVSARKWCDELSLALGAAVDFWTEASLFSAAGVPAVVLGPGDIAQAHTVDEWVALEQLWQAAAHYRRIAEHG